MWIDDLEKCKTIIRAIKDADIYKITFSGGEPTLHPYIKELIVFAKELGLTTSIVTNGTRITSDFIKQLKGCLDIVAISIDSAVEETEKLLGRGTGTHVERSQRVCELIHKEGLRLKVNTVVTTVNYMEDMRSYINMVLPERWKVFQFLPIQGENDAESDNLSVTKDQFNLFIRTNSKNISVPIVPEDNDAMTSSYIIVDPLGYIMQNHQGRYIRGKSLFESSLKAALEEIGFDLYKFVNRGGSYQ
jgi:radical S-adenosyl methionine domain-containing protein 2